MIAKSFQEVLLTYNEVKKVKIISGNHEIVMENFNSHDSAEDFLSFTSETSILGIHLNNVKLYQYNKSSKVLVFYT